MLYSKYELGLTDHLIKVKNLSEKFKSFFNGGFKLYDEEDKQRAIKIWKAFFSDRYFDTFIRLD